MGFRNIQAYVDAVESGRSHYCSFRKIPSQTSAAGIWVDASMAGGNPLPNYYASSPLTADVLDGSRGLFHGADKAPETKHLTELSICVSSTATVGQFMLLDYLMYYPFFDGDDTEPQVMVNPITLPRYADGDGVMVMAVTVAPATGGGSFTFTYINQDGVQKTSPVQGCVAGAIANLVNSQQATVNGNGPFLKLAAGDRGVRSIVSAQFSVPNGGLYALVLVKPILDHAVREINTYSEVVLPLQRPFLPRIYDGAYLNLIFVATASPAGTSIVGHARFAWGI